MYTEYEIRELPLSLKSVRDKVTNFLSNNDLRLEDVDAYFGIFSIDGENILAGGGYKGNLIKCIAVDDNIREEGFSNRLISHLVSTVISNGYSSVKVYTKPTNKDIFESLGFVTIAQSEYAILMDNSEKDINSYKKYLSSQKKEGNNGVIVMNANPFTKGHRYLIEQASKQVDNLYIIAVKEDKSFFSSEERYKMIEKGCSDLKNVTICKGSEYIISSSTFPTYFLKKITDASITQIELDLDIFVKHIAPSLGATIRFVGSEPIDNLTNQYNLLMKKILPKCGIEVVEIERLKTCCSDKTDDKIISASLVREFINNGKFYEASKLVYDTTIPYLIAALAIRAIQMELDTTPKPGLVDKNDSGAHIDMDYKLMSESIKALRPYFTQLSTISWREELPPISTIIEIGKNGEEAMLASTKGVNTYKGALFCIGLMIIATSNIFYKKREYIKDEELAKIIMQISKGIKRDDSSHGATVQNKFKIKGALQMAQEGYPLLFKKWITYYKSNIDDIYNNHKTLLLIMSELDDSNVYYRKGKEGSKLVKTKGKELFENFSIKGLEELNKMFTFENISPGGSADMLSLTIFANSIKN